MNFLNYFFPATFCIGILFTSCSEDDTYFNEIEPKPEYTDCRIADSLALISVYNKCNGPEWYSQWDFSKPIDKWNGIKLENDRVSSVYLSSNNLSGSLPEDIKKITELKNLYLAHNQLSGILPTFLPQMSYINDIDLSYNDFTGTIPQEYAYFSVKADICLFLFSNFLTAPLPEGIAYESDNIKYRYQFAPSDKYKEDELEDLLSDFIF